MEKQTQLSALCRECEEEVEHLKTQAEFWKRAGKLVENKISLGQSILSNITSQVRAGMYFNEAK